MRKFVVFAFLLTITPSFAQNIYDARWCRENGGAIEFDFKQNIKFNCMLIDVNSTPYAEKIYNTICIPYLSSILKNREPLFLKVVADYENKNSLMFDEFNWKITKDELVRYI